MSSEWPIVKLGSLADFQEGYVNPSQREPSYFDGPVKWLRATDLNDSVVTDTTRTLSAKGFSSAGKSAVLFEPGTLAISKSGTIGRLGIIGDYMCGNRAVINIKPKQNAVPRYIFFVLRYLRPTIETLAEGSVQKNLYVSTLSNLDVPAPPKGLQQAFADTLGVLDDRITLLRETNATLEAIAQALFKSWFVDFDPVRAKMEGRVPEGMDEATAALFPDSFEETELGEVPRGWRVMPLSDAYEINPSRKLKKGEAAPYLDMASVDTKSHVVSSVIQREMSSGTKFINGDTLLARITPCLENGKTAFVDFLPDDQTGWGSTEFVVLRPKEPLPPYHGYLLARHPAFRGHAIQSMSGTSGRQRVQNDVLGRFLVNVPSPQAAEIFGSIVNGIQQKIAANHGQAEVLAELRDSLLPLLISGQLRLPEVQHLIGETAA